MKKAFLISLFLILVSLSGLAQTSIQGREVDVRAFGAKCDGVTNDQTAVQTAIAAVTATGGVVNLPDGTCLVTGLTLPGGVTLRGKGQSATTIKSSTNAVIVDAVEGSGSFAFLGPKIFDLRVQGSKTAGSNQIGIRVDDLIGIDPVLTQAVLENIQVYQAGSHGIYVGNAFSSRFVNIFSDDNTGYPVLINSANMPSNHYENVYAQATNAGANAGFRIMAGNFICISCNGINNSFPGSWNAILGQSTALGDASNVSVFAHWINSNFESAQAGGIFHKYNSVSTFDGKNTFIGVGNLGVSTTLSAGINNSVTTIPVASAAAFASSGTVLIDTELISYASKDATNLLGATRGVGLSTAASHSSAAVVTDNVYIAMKYEIDSAIFPPFFSKGKLDDSVIFASSPNTFYANSQPIHANDIPPITIDGVGPRVADNSLVVSGYRNTTLGNTQQLMRSDAYFPVVAVTTSTSFANPGPRYFEVTCGANCTLTLPWPGWYRWAEQVVVKNLSTSGVVVTIAANSGGTVNGAGSLVITTSGQAVSLLANPGALDWRVMVNSSPTNTASNQVQAYNVKVDGGCVANGVANDTACVAASYTAAIAANRPLYFPAGTYLIDTGTLVIATNGIEIFGDAPNRTIIKSRNSTTSLITIDASSVNPHTISVHDLTLEGFGSGANNNGILVSGVNTPFNVQFRNLRILNFTGRGIYDTAGMFQSRLDNIVVSQATTGNNAIDLLGANDLLIQNCYVTVTGNNTAAYRIHSGRPTLISNNGINPGSTSASWAVFGDVLAEDGADRFVSATLIGNNIEDFTANGARFKVGSFGSFTGNSFIAPTTGTVTPLKFDFVDNGQRGMWDATNSIQTTGAAYTNGNPLNSRGAPFIQVGGNAFTSYYDTTIAATISFPYLTPQLIPGSTNIALIATRLQATVLESSSLAGDFTGTTDFGGNSSRVLFQDGTAARPTNTFVSDSDTGIYRAGANIIGFAAGGVEVATLGTALTLGRSAAATGTLSLYNSSNSNTTILQPGAPASPVTLTLPATLPASAGCLQVSSTGVITQTGAACGAGGGSVEWQTITNPTGNQALAMGAFTTAWTWNAATGASNLFTLTDTASNTGTGYVLNLNTASSSAAKPARITAGGTANGVEMTTAGVLASIGTGSITANTGDSATAFFPAGQIELARGGTGADLSATGGTGQYVKQTTVGGALTVATIAAGDLPGSFSGFANPSASIGLTANNGVATTAMRSDATPALSQSIAPTWTGLHTFNPGTTPTDAVLLDIAAIGSAGTRDSHNLVMRGRSNNGTAHTVEWKQFVDVTSNAGASQWILRSNRDGGSFSNWLTITDLGQITGGAFFGATFATAGGAIIDDDINATTGFTIANVAPSGQYLRGNGTRAAFAAIASGDLPSTVVRTDQANAYSTGAQDFTSATSLTVPVSEGAAPTANGTIAYDSTANALEYGDNGTNQTVANLDEVQTFSGVKTFSSAPVISTITNTGTVTLFTSTDTVVGRATTDTLTNKTLTASSNVLGGVTMTVGSDATGDIYYRNSGGVLTRLGIGTAGQVLTVASGLPSWAAGGGGSSPPFVDTTSIVEGSADGTKELRFEVDGFTTATVRVLTPQNADYTIAGTNIAQTFSAAQTFSVNPVISAITNTGTLTLPTSTDTLIGRATTDTLTNKTIDSANNLITLPISDLVSSSANATFTQTTFNTTFTHTTGLLAASWSGNTATSSAFALSHSNTTATGTLLNLSTSASVNVKPLTISPKGSQSFQADHLGNLIIGNAALSTGAVNGFLYLPSSAGVPTGTPTSYTGRVPVEVDTTNSRLYGYFGGAWVNLTGSGGSGLGDPGANGVVVRTALNTTTARTITAGSSNGLAVTDGTGVSGNPTVDFSTTNTSGLGFHLPGNGGLPFVTDSSLSLAGSANEVRVALFYAPGRITVDRIGVNGVVDSASNNAGFGIYSSDGNTKICDSGAISTTSWSGANNFALSASCTFGPGYFYYAWTANSTTPTARSGAGITNFFAPLNSGAGTTLGTAANASSGGVLPTTLGTLTDVNSQGIPIVRFYKN